MWNSTTSKREYGLVPSDGEWKEICLRLSSQEGDRYHEVSANFTF